MGNQLARTLNNALLAHAASEGLPEFIIRQHIAISGFTTRSYVEDVLAGTRDPDDVALAAFARVLDIPEARLKADLRADQGVEPLFDFPASNEGSDPEADATQSSADAS